MTNPKLVAVVPQLGFQGRCGIVVAEAGDREEHAGSMLVIGLSGIPKVIIFYILIFQSFKLDVLPKVPLGRQSLIQGLTSRLFIWGSDSKRTELKFWKR